MLIVECITEDFEWEINGDKALIAIRNGAPCPIKGEHYIVSGYKYDRDEKGVQAYQLEDIDWSKYGLDVWWRTKYFKKVSEEFTPNNYNKMLGFHETIKMNATFNFDNEDSDDSEESVYTFEK